MGSRKIKVMVVDDSLVVRGLLKQALTSDPDIEIVATASNGKFALDELKNVKPDIIILDVEMPVMDGLTAIPEILKIAPTAKIIMCSSLTQKNADTTLKALELGAIECIAKPTSQGEDQGNAMRGAFKDNLLYIVKSLGKADLATAEEAVAIKEKFTLRVPPPAFMPKLLAVGSSTGGPQALMEVLPNFKGSPIPIVITQHMPPTFTATLAEHLRKKMDSECVEGQDGMVLEPGKFYVAPGGYHMGFEKSDAGVKIKIMDTPPENFCKPAVDPMIRSAMEIYGSNILAVILTGMGNDGQKGCQALVEAGGLLVAQDEATSVVWGMPGAVAMDNNCHAVLPLNEIGQWVRSKL